jgi:hypothetical protein
VAAGAFATPHPETSASQWQHFPGLFHARLLPDGRVAAVAPVGVLGLPELWIFAPEAGTWRIDEIGYLAGEHADAGIVGDTLTTASRLVDIHHDRSGYGYGYGLEWDPGWKPLIQAEVGLTGGTVLTNGTSILVVGTPFTQSETGEPLRDLTACPPPLSGKARADLRRLGLDPAYFDQTAGLAPAVDANGFPLRGNDGQRSTAVYDVQYRAGGTDAPAKPYRLDLECHAMGEGRWVLGVAHLAPAAAYETEVAAREQVLATLEG